MELLHGSSQGEREPKTKKLMAIVGIVTLAAGYYMAITVDNPVTAVLLFFVAVILVIIGTYFIFMAGSIAVLKFLRKRKSYYYKKKHFVAVSGLIYRMKQNASRSTDTAGKTVCCALYYLLPVFHINPYSCFSPPVVSIVSVSEIFAYNSSLVKLPR